MNLIYQGVHWSEFARLAFYDKETGNLPQIHTKLTHEELRAVFGTHGIVAAPQNDIDVEVEVYEGLGMPPGTSFVRSGQIMVGHQGLMVGDEPDGDEISWPAGMTQVSVFMDDIRFGWARKIVFVLTRQG